MNKYSLIFFKDSSYIYGYDVFVFFYNFLVCKIIGLVDPLILFLHFCDKHNLFKLYHKKYIFAFQFTAIVSGVFLVLFHLCECSC